MKTMKFVFWWAVIATGTGLFTLALVFISPFLIMGMLWSGTTGNIEGVNNSIQDCYYVLGKSAKKLLKPTIS